MVGYTVAKKYQWVLDKMNLKVIILLAMNTYHFFGIKLKNISLILIDHIIVLITEGIFKKSEE